MGVYLEPERVKFIKGENGEVLPPPLVVEAVKTFDCADEIIPTLRFAGDHWYFERWGMYVGIEFDGYVHT